MFYIKDKNGNELVLGEEKTFTKCGYCGKEMEVEFDDIDDFYGTTHYCNSDHAKLAIFMNESYITELEYRFKDLCGAQREVLKQQLKEVIAKFLVMEANVYDNK